MTTPATRAPGIPLDALSDDAVAARSADEPAWLRDRRHAALKRFLDQRWPDSRADEYWRSTPFDRRFDVSLPLAIGDGGLGDAPEPVTATLGLETALARVVDGVVVDVSIPASLAERGVVVADLSAAASSHEDLVRTHLGSLTTSATDGTGSDEDRTISANDAAWSGGVFVHVPDDVELEAPIGVQIHVAQPGTHLPRVLVVVGTNAQATVYVEHTSSDLGAGKALVSEVVESVLLDGARLKLATLNEWGSGVAHLSLQKAAAHRDATYHHLSLNVGGDTIRLRPEVDLVGPGSSCYPLGIYFTDEGQWFDLQPYIRHIAPRATSDVLFKGALQGKSRTVFRGNVLVGKDAVGTDTNEQNKALILTDGARADSTPFLEILCADIKAGHGSATGQIDARHLFYLESRGIEREQALRLIVQGFFREVLDRVDLPGLESRALTHIEREIDRADLERIGVRDATPEGELE